MSWKRRIKATPQELAYRKKYFHDIRIIRDKQIVCTACGNKLNIETKQIFSNPVIGILLCEVCWNHLKNIEAKFDKDEAKRYCHICGERSKQLYVCCNKDCFSAFCKGCIKRNVNSSLLDAVKEDWKCFTCNSKPIWDLRGICAAVMDSLPKKGNKRSIKNEKRILPSQIQRVEKTREVQKVLRSLCDREDDDSSTKSFVSARSQKVDTKNRHTNHDTSSIRQKTTMEVDLTDSSSDNSSIFSNKRDKRSKSDKEQKAKSTRDSSDRNMQKDTRSVIKERTSKKLIISSDSMDSTDSSSKTITGKRISRRNVKSEKIVKRKTNSNRIHSSDNESDENDTKRASNVSKRISKDTRQQNKKMENSYNAKSKDEAKKCYDSTSESEDEEYKRRSRKKRSETSRTSHSNNDERKRDKSSNSRFSNIQDDSDNSSSKEFQKKKLQKVNHKKYSMRKLVDLDIDHTKSPSVKNSVNDKSEKQIDGQADQNFNDIKKILEDCKKKCSNFQMFIESIEQLYGKGDEEQLILKSAENIDKLKTVLEEKRKNLTTSYQLWSKNRKKSATKRYKVISDDEQSSKECEKRTVDEDIRISGDEQGGNKAVSECDSEEIFSANETKTGKMQKMQAAQSKASTTRTKNNNGTDTDEEEDRMSVDESKNNDKDNVDVRNDLAVSPVIGTLKEKKTSTERSSKKQLLSECNKNNNKIQPTDENTNTNDKASLNTDISNDETEIEDSPSRDNCGKRTLENDEVGQSRKRNIINESTDLFDTSFEDAGENRTEVEIETNCDKEKPLRTSEDKFSDPCKDSLKDKVPDKEERASLLSYNMGEEKDLSNQVAQEKMASSATKEAHDNTKTNGKTNTDNESLDDAEALAKKALLATDSDTSDTLSDKDVAKLTEDLKVTNNTNQTEKNKTEDDDSDSVSTVMLSTFIKKTNTDEKDTITDEGKTKVEKKSDNRLDKKSRKKKSSSDEDAKIAKAERAAKRALLESNSDDSTPLSSESEKIADKKSESDSSEKNIKAKLLLLASSSEISSPEMANVSKSTKRNHEPDSDKESAVTRLKKRRLNLDKNYYYKNDKKLRMSCKVHLNRLSAEVLKCHSHALGKSTEYLEHKALKSLINLDKLEKSRKKNAKKDSDSLTDDDSSSKIARRSNKQKEKAKAKEESLMDHLKRIENDNISPTAEMDSDTDIEESVHQISKVDDIPVSNEALMSEADRIAKENLLNTSDSSEKEVAMDSDDNINNDDKDKTVENKKKKHQKTEEKTSKQDSKKDTSNWRRDKLLTGKLFDTDSESERKKWKKKQEKIANESKENNSDSDEERLKSKKKKKKKKVARRILDSDSDVKITDVDSDSSEISSAKQNSSESESDSKREKEKLRRKRRKRGDSNSSDTDSSLTEKKSKPKRKRIKKMASDSDSSDAEIKNSQGSTPGKSGRKNIRKVLKDKQVAEDTKLAAKEEEERLKRIAERQTLYNEMYEMRLAGEEKVDKLVLDFDTETKKELVTVHEELVKRLKPHQAQGIKFMWDACFESLERVKTTSGSGCIIAHCMGLGKTLQVIALTHTLLTHEETKIKTVLIVCPLSTVLNWLNEYNTWLKDLDDIEVYELTKFKKNFERKYQLQRWQRTGGVMIIGYEMFRNLTGPNKNIRKGMKEAILECLVDPGADLVVCDEGHLLKNEDTALSKCMRSVKTLRRIVLTGTPLQNNLIEYHCMVQFVKPNLLGTKKEFLNRFVNPITNGQFDDSTAYDVKLMKKRAHVLHKMLEGSVQRFDYSVLTPFLPPKQEYVIFVRLTDTQVKMYQYYLENLARRQGGQGGTLFADFQALQRIWTHPVVLRLNAEKIERANEKKELSESEGSLKDFINDDTTDIETTSINSDSSNDSDVQAVTIDDDKNVPKPSRRTRNNPVEEEPEEPEHKEENTESEWWTQFVQSEHFEDMRVSAKLLLLFGILKECEQIGDKVLVFSQSLYSLTLIEEFLRRIDDQTQNDTLCETLDNHTGSWSLGLDYFRLDGQTSPENRNLWCKIFNKPTNTRARLFLISTRAGGLGINLTAANRVIIFDASWNPSHDVQSIFRIYRFGQKKPCYVYRFLAAGTMEEKIYNRQVTKLSLSCRVVDEQQIERHYSNHNLNELYMFEGYNDKEKPTLNLPKDRLLAEIFLKFKDYVENYHEHDSLLENKAEEELDEEERKQAWLEYEEEKKGKPPMMNTMLVNPMANTAYQNNMFLQQYSMMMNSVMPQNMQVEYENLQQLIRKDYPNATPEQQKLITNRALMEMYNYWEKQATLFNKQPTQPIRNPVMPNFQQRPQTPNFQQRPQVPSNSNVHVNQQATQLNQLLSGQSMNYINTNKPGQPSGAQMADLLPNITYRNTLSANNISGNTDQDIMEVIPSTSNAGVTRQSGMSSAQVAAQPIDNSKIQEE